MIPASRRYADSDRFAGDCARTAILSQSGPLDIIGICEGLRCPIPISGADLEALALLCKRWGIRCVLDDEPPVFTEGIGGNWSYIQGGRS